jgi:hypothetical protein
MVTFEDELYLLDNTTGGVVRAFLTNRGYEVDYSFQCNPGVHGEVTLGAFIDIVAWQAGYSPEARVLAADSSGNVLFCIPDQAPIPARISPGSEDAWGEVLAVALDQSDFYALDVPSNGIWIYWRSKFEEAPTLFFDEEIPPLRQVIDMVVDRDDLYLMQSDGSLMLCVRNTMLESLTRCSMVAYADRRPGKENLPLVPPGQFSQLLFIPPPDPSLFILEPRSQAVYHFSLRNLAFQRQFLPENPLPAREATAFTSNSSRGYLYLAIGSQVFYAVIP